MGTWNGPFFCKVRNQNAGYHPEELENWCVGSDEVEEREDRVLPSWTRHCEFTTIHLQIGITQDIYVPGFPPKQTP